MGSVWANTLHNVYAELVATFGWSSTALTDTTSNEGNVVWLHLLFDALLLQPCNPTCEFSPCGHDRLDCHMSTLTRNGQSSKRGTRGFRQTQTDIRGFTRACCGKPSPAEDSVSTRRASPMIPHSLLNVTANRLLKDVRTRGAGARARARERRVMV